MTDPSGANPGKRRDEFARIAKLRALFARPSDRVEVSIGDDAAVFPSFAGPSAISIDTSIENVHFRRTWLPWRDVGYRAQVAAMSDLAATGAEPRVAVVALALPADFTDEAFDDLNAGIVEARDAIGYELIGGNLARADVVSVTTTVLGELTGPAVLREGARPGDGIYVTGSVGVASAGLAALDRNLCNDATAPVIARWRRPPIRFSIARDVRAIASACIDVSDGLLQDLGHLTRASGVGARVDVSKVPRGSDFAAAAAALDVDTATFGLNGGEDYELLFTSSEHASAARLGTRIGDVVEGAGLALHDPDGRPVSLPGGGFDHFGT